MPVAPLPNGDVYEVRNVFNAYGVTVENHWHIMRLVGSGHNSFQDLVDAGQCWVFRFLDIWALLAPRGIWFDSQKVRLVNHGGTGWLRINRGIPSSPVGAMGYTPNAAACITQTWWTGTAYRTNHLYWGPLGDEDIANGHVSIHVRNVLTTFNTRAFNQINFSGRTWRLCNWSRKLLKATRWDVSQIKRDVYFLKTRQRPIFNRRVHV